MKRYWFIICLASVVAILACKTVIPKSIVTTPLPPATLTLRISTIQPTNGQVVCITNLAGKVKCFTNETHPYNPLKSYGFTYSGITDNIVFNVFGSSNLSNWSYKGTVTNMWFTVDSSKGDEFYRVQTSNTVTHYVSQ